MKAQAQAWAEAEARPAASRSRRSTRGVAASGAILGQTPQQFSASWAFVIEPLEGGRSRLIERFRVWYGESGMASHVVMPVVGFGVFVMMQRQMPGISTRAERLARTRVTPPAPIHPDPGRATAGRRADGTSEAVGQGSERPRACHRARRLTTGADRGARRRPRAAGARRGARMP